MTEHFMFLYDSIAEAVRKVGDAVYWWVFFNPLTAFIIFWSLVVIAFVWGTRRWWRSEKGENYKMAQRKAYLDRLFADMIGDGLTDLYLSGKLKPHEYRKSFKKFGVKHGLTDLMPRKIHPSAIKTRVRKNISSMKLLDASGRPIQPSIPGPKPGEVTLPPHKEPKRWVVIRKKLLRRAV